MKKTLLLAAAAVATLSSQAAFSDVAKASIEGNPITEGCTIDVTTFHDNDWWVDPDTDEKDHMGGGYQYVAEIDVENLKAAEIATSIKVEYTDMPTEAMAVAEPEVWGTLQICQKGAACFPDLSVTTKIDANATLTWQFDNNLPCAYPDAEGDHDALEKVAADRKYKVTLTADSEAVSFFVNFKTVKEDTGVAGVAVAEGAAEYFDLQGRRVANPEKGLYIVKKNGKTSKMVIR